MSARTPISRLARSIACLVFIATGLDANAAPPIRDQTLPDLDQRLGAVLDLTLGELTVAPRPAAFPGVDQYKEALARLGDLAYEDGQGGMLFVASGFALPLGSEAPTPTILRGLDARLQARTFLLGPELDPGAWFAVRSRAGELSLGRVVARSGESIRLAWSPPQDPNTRVRTQWVDAIAKVGAPHIATALLPPLIPPTGPLREQSDQDAPATLLEKTPDAVLRLDDGKFSLGPQMSLPLSAGSLAELVRKIGKSGDLAYFRPRSGMLVVAGGKIARLGTGLLAPLEGRNLGPRLKERSIIPAAELLPGSAILVETSDANYALVRIDSIEPEGLQISWLLQADGSAVFDNLAAFDASFRVPDPQRLNRLLLAAAVRGDSLQIRRLLDMGADPNARSTNNARSPLIHAVIHGHPDVIALLLEADADLSATGSDGWNALHVAVKLGRMDIVETLIAAGSDTQARLPDGANALQIALQAPNQGVDLIRLLRANTKTPDTLTLAARVGDVETILALIEAGANVDLPGKGGQSPLEVAAAAGQTAAVRALLTGGADPGFESDTGISPLEVAAAKGHVETAAILIKHGGITDAQKASALYRANQSGSAEMARVLLEEGADALGDAGQALTPLDYTFQYGSDSLVNVYLERGHELNVATAARLGRVEELTTLLSSGSNPREAGPDGRSPLQLAIANNRTESVAVLLDHGVAANLPLETWDRRTPLHEAAAGAESNTVDLLLNWGADANPLDRVGRTPLYEAVSHGRETAVRVLLEHGADPNLAPPGESLMEAAGQTSIRELLASYGARSPGNSHRN
jgi:uncharacterized protein